jgi:ribosomal protein L11 methyltransferase
MQYTKVTFPEITQDLSDILIAMLAEAGFEGFEEGEGSLIAFVPTPLLDVTELERLAKQFGVDYETMQIPAQNWNALWESNFQPVMVDDFCTVRAHFHDLDVTTTYDIVVTPKMSFGTGHHATTQLMILGMKHLPLDGAKVLDFGTGTGVLAILAEMLGAASVLAIDNDEWSVENALENVERNGCSRISVKKGSLDEVGEGMEDVILANINRHILLQYMPMLYARLAKGGSILMSGLLTEDLEIITAAAKAAGFAYVSNEERSNWIAILFVK